MCSKINQQKESFHSPPIVSEGVFDLQNKTNRRLDSKPKRPFTWLLVNVR